MSYQHDPRREKPQRFQRRSRAFVLADGSTICLVAAKRTGINYKLPSCPVPLPVNGVIAGVVQRPRFWFIGGLLKQHTTVQPLPAFMPPYQEGANFAFTPKAEDLAAWIKQFEAIHQPRRAPWLRLPATAHFLLGC